MAHIKKKFTFDDPEDSYWNESGSNSSSLFDDLPSKQWGARAAVDNLFEQRDVFSAKVPPQSSTIPQATANSAGEVLKLISALQRLTTLNSLEKIFIPCFMPELISAHLMQLLGQQCSDEGNGR